MKTYTTTAPQITTAEALNALQILTAYTKQTTAHALRVARRAALIARLWLTDRHDFGNEEGAIISTGWQYLGIGAAVVFGGLLLSIQY